MPRSPRPFYVLVLLCASSLRRVALFGSSFLRTLFPCLPFGVPLPLAQSNLLVRPPRRPPSPASASPSFLDHHPYPPANLLGRNKSAPTSRMSGEGAQSTASPTAVDHALVFVEEFDALYIPSPMARHDQAFLCASVTRLTQHFFFAGQLSSALLHRQRLPWTMSYSQLHPRGPSILVCP